MLPKEKLLFLFFNSYLPGSFLFFCFLEFKESELTCCFRETSFLLKNVLFVGKFAITSF